MAISASTPAPARRTNIFNESPAHRGLIDIKVENSQQQDEASKKYTTSLWLCTSGALRPTAKDNPQPLQPAIILIHGMGSFTSEWAPTVRLLKQAAPENRVYVYDRPGMGGSSIVGDISSLPPRLAETSARELIALFRAVIIPPPYILVGHSFGGVIIREFLNIVAHPELYYPSAGGSPIPRSVPVSELIKGVVFVDHSVSFADLPRTRDSLVGEGDYATIVGIAKANGVPPKPFDRSEWAATRRDGARSVEGILAEEKTAHESWDRLKRLDQEQFESESHLLGDARVSVIHADSTLDFERVYAYSSETGNGKDEDRREFREAIDQGWKETDERLQRRLLNLSTNSRWRDVPDHGHSVHITAPEIVVEEIQWALGGAETIGQ